VVLFRTLKWKEITYLIRSIGLLQISHYLADGENFLLVSFFFKDLYWYHGKPKNKILNPLQENSHMPHKHEEVTYPVAMFNVHKFSNVHYLNNRSNVIVLPSAYKLNSNYQAYQTCVKYLFYPQISILRFFLKCFISCVHLHYI